MGTGFLDRVNLDVWHLTPRTGPEYVSRVGVKQQGPCQIPLAEAESTGRLVTHGARGLGLGVLLPLSPYGTPSSSLSLKGQALRHTQAPGGLLLGVHRPALCMHLGPGALTPLTALNLL